MPVEPALVVCPIYQLLELEETLLQEGEAGLEEREAAPNMVGVVGYQLTKRIKFIMAAHLYMAEAVEVMALAVIALLQEMVEMEERLAVT